MTKTPQTEADELVEMFLELFYHQGSDNDRMVCVGYANDAAILHVERLIEVLDGLLKDYPIGKVYHYHQHYQQVLSILKNKK